MLFRSVKLAEQANEMLAGNTVVEFEADAIVFDDHVELENGDVKDFRYIVTDGERYRVLLMPKESTND